MGEPRVLVIHPPVSVARDFIDYPYFADLGAVQLAAVLERELDPAQVELVDSFALPGAQLRWREDGRAHLGVEVEQALAQVLRLAADQDFAAIVLAYTVFHRPPHRDDVLAALLEGLRARFDTAPILLADCYQSGQHYIELPGDAVLASYPEVDAYIKYEAEVTVPQLLASYFANPNEPGARPRGSHRGASPKLDELPFPAWGRVDLAAYDQFKHSVVAELGRPVWTFPIDGRTMPLVTSRGCPFTCIHCSSNPEARKPWVADAESGGPEPQAREPKLQRRYSPERLREYLRFMAALGTTRLEVSDELINVNERHFDVFLEEVVALDLKFDCPNGMRADYLLPRHLEQMRGRVNMLSVSAESGVQRVVTEVVKKRLDLRAVEDAAKHAHEAGVPLMIHYMIGLPGERAEEINGTLGFALRLWDEFQAWPAVQYATPLPGTELAAIAEARSGHKLPVIPTIEDWGPYFQTAPSNCSGDGTGDGVDQATLETFMWTFQQRLNASQGAKKLIMNVTYVCNNHCTFCAVGTRTQLDGHPTRQREKLLEYRKQGVVMVDFDGGEPTLNPELIPLIKSARAMGYQRVNVTTNGRRCVYDKYASSLVNSGLTTLLFSVHGHDARTHAQQVGVAEAFQQTTDGIRNCLRYAPKGVELGMNITVTKGNHDKVDRLAQLCWDLGLRWMNIQFLTPFGRATSWVAPDTQLAADNAVAVMDAWAGKIRFQVINLPFCFMPKHRELMQGDLAKLERHMVFVNNETVNLAEYLAERRVRKPVCKTCPHACFCGGFYELDQVPEPPWLISAEDLVRPLSDPRRHESVPAGFSERVKQRLREEGVEG
ncbi:radical SAM protein [Enhygromyxa salina]|uniref:Pyrroloquinoline quinone biosynthesis protein PqqE n=1 Tax=Enhygromyxa salina TaxID=215803 RepID=A0A2S9YJJ6_9BACT|nr:radical SAM protein [Enhygromyxa salina]PRQ05206.1 pyrroloquinoline quinone biosynthesis protein PqqE [Enhygromyxa salina]